MDYTDTPSTAKWRNECCGMLLMSTWTGSMASDVKLEHSLLDCGQEAMISTGAIPGGVYWKATIQLWSLKLL